MQVALTTGQHGQLLLRANLSEPHIGLSVTLAPGPSASVVLNFFYAFEQSARSAYMFQSVLTLLIPRFLLFDRVIMRSDYDELCRKKRL